MNEKRYFKIYCKRHVIGGQNKYVSLFEIIQKSDHSDEEILKKNLSEMNYSLKFLSSDMNYLKRIVLKSLNEFHSEKTFDIKFKQQLISIEILFYKGLYEECLQLIRKVKEIKLAEENQYLMLELINWEKKCIGYSKGLLKAIEVNNKQESYFDTIKITKDITNYYYTSYYLKNSLGKVSKEEIKAFFDDMFQNSIFTSVPNLKTIHTKIFYNLIYSNYYHVMKDTGKELEYLKKTISFFEDNKEYKFENPLDYISIYSRIIEIKKYDDNPDFYTELNTLRDFKSILDLQKEVANERIFLFSIQTELEHLLATNQLELAMTKMNDMRIALSKTKYKIEPYHYIKIYYLIASIYCSNGDYSSGLKYVNKIMNEFKFKDRPNTYIKTEFLNIMIHYELKNYSLVLNNLTGFLKKYKKEYELLDIEKLLLKTIQNISENPLIMNEKKEFKKLIDSIKSTTQVEKSLVNTVYLRYIISKTG